MKRYLKLSAIIVRIVFFSIPYHYEFSRCYFIFKYCLDFTTLNRRSPKIALSRFPTPNPHPNRGVYGFVFFIIAWVFLAVYLLWALLPNHILDTYFIAYYPSKLWTIILPSVVFTLFSKFDVFIISTIFTFSSLHHWKFPAEYLPFS
jgi:hypothetical protein